MDYRVTSTSLGVGEGVSAPPLSESLAPPHSSPPCPQREGSTAKSSAPLFQIANAFLSSGDTIEATHGQSLRILPWVLGEEDHPRSLTNAALGTVPRRAKHLVVHFTLVPPASGIKDPSYGSPSPSEDILYIITGGTRYEVLGTLMYS